MFLINPQHRADPSRITQCVRRHAASGRTAGTGVSPRHRRWTAWVP